MFDLFEDGPAKGEDVCPPSEADAQKRKRMKKGDQSYVGRRRQLLSKGFNWALVQIRQVGQSNVQQTFAWNTQASIHPAIGMEENEQGVTERVT